MSIFELIYRPAHFNRHRQCPMPRSSDRESAPERMSSCAQQWQATWPARCTSRCSPGSPRATRTVPRRSSSTGRRRKPRCWELCTQGKFAVSVSLNESQNNSQCSISLINEFNLNLLFWNPNQDGATNKKIFTHTLNINIFRLTH